MCVCRVDTTEFTYLLVSGLTVRLFSPFSESVYNAWQSFSILSFKDNVTLSTMFPAVFCLDFPAISLSLTHISNTIKIITHSP